MTDLTQSKVLAPMAGSVVSIDIAVGDSVSAGQSLAVLEAMKMHHEVIADSGGVVQAIHAAEGDIVEEDGLLISLTVAGSNDESISAVRTYDLDAERRDLNEVYSRHEIGRDENRPEAVAKRHDRGSRTARENIADLCDADTLRKTFQVTH